MSSSPDATQYDRLDLAKAIEKSSLRVRTPGIGEWQLTEEAKGIIIAALRSTPSETAPSCVCGNSTALNTVHRTDGPCYSAPSAIATKALPADLWDEIKDFIYDHVDVRDGSDGQPLPNRAMSLWSRIDREIP